MWSELCLKNLNQLASIGLVEMDEDCFLLKPTGYYYIMSAFHYHSINCIWWLRLVSNIERITVRVSFLRYSRVITFLTQYQA